MTDELSRSDATVMEPGFGGWISGPEFPIDPERPQPTGYRPISRLDSLRPITERLDEVFARCPAKIALNDGKRQLTFEQLRRAIAFTARQILETTPAGRPVAAVLNNSVAFPVVYLACLVAGRPAGLIDATHPIDRQAAIFAELRPGSLILEKNTIAKPDYVGSDVPTINLDPLEVPSLTMPEGLPDPRAVAGIGFTSGSTGSPKGLAFRWFPIAETVRLQSNSLAISEDDVLMSAASLSMMGIRDAVVSALTGATLHLVDVKEVGLDGVLRTMKDQAVTRFGFIPSALKALIRLPAAREAFSQLRSLDLVGEPVVPADIEMIRPVLPPGCKICLVFGVTEATVMFRYFVPERPIEGKSIPIGYLEPGRRIALVDEDGRSVPHGEVGELVVADDGLALGSWRQGQLEDGAFLPDPNRRDGRLYWTGDLVRFRDGDVAEFRGRRDRMVKIIGLKADLREVEETLCSLEGVHDAAVVPIERVGNSTVLVAFLTAAADQPPPTDGQIRRIVNEATASHMVPQAIRWLEELPRLPNGKPDLVTLKSHAAALLNNA